MSKYQCTRWSCFVILRHTRTESSFIRVLENAEMKFSRSYAILRCISAPRLMLTKHSASWNKKARDINMMNSLKCPSNTSSTSSYSALILTTRKMTYRERQNELVSEKIIVLGGTTPSPPATSPEYPVHDWEHPAAFPPYRRRRKKAEKKGKNKNKKSSG